MKKNSFEERRRFFKFVSINLSIASLVLIISTAGLSDNNLISFKDTFIRVIFAVIIFIISYTIYSVIHNYEENMNKNKKER